MIFVEHEYFLNYFATFPLFLTYKIIKMNKSNTYTNIIYTSTSYRKYLNNFFQTTQLLFDFGTTYSNRVNLILYIYICTEIIY